MLLNILKISEVKMLALVTKNNDKNHYHRKSKGFYVKINYIELDGP